MPRFIRSVLLSSSRKHPSIASIRLFKQPGHGASNGLGAEKTEGNRLDTDTQRIPCKVNR